jgi:predicted metal-binding membrane protein
MDEGPTLDPGGFGLYVSMWVAMTAAMMLPSVTPTLMLVDRLSRSATPSFAAGYLLTWTAIGVTAYALIRLFAGADVDPQLTGPLLVLAGVYQLTPLKNACLHRCRSPLAFLRAHAGDGPLRAGAAHGAYCVGCCAGLMLVLFGVGLTSLFWMAAIAAAVAVEKVAPRGDRLSRPIALALIAGGLVVTIT